MGVKVQVLKRGTMFGPRAHRLYELYRAFAASTRSPAAERAKLEKEMLGAAAATRSGRATQRLLATSAIRRRSSAPTRDPKHKMALVFRWYLGLSSQWAITGEATRRLDYQIWCGPAMGAFNDWVRGLVPRAAREPHASRRSRAI